MRITTFGLGATDQTPRDPPDDRWLVVVPAYTPMFGHWLLHGGALIPGELEHFQVHGTRHHRIFLT